MHEEDCAPSESAGLDAIQEPTYEAEVPCQFRCGRAGTGKTFGILRDAGEDPNFGVITATTGIAAVNLGSVTLNSTLKYFDTASLRDNYYSGLLARTIHDNLMGRKWLVIDEGSMLEALQLSLVYRGVADANKYKDVTAPLGILLVADFGQLPPVEGEWAFASDYWEGFARNTTRLEKVWRQEDAKFLAALNLVRYGRGKDAADAFDALGVQWHTARDGDFDGTTVVPVNDLVSRHNDVALEQVRGKRFKVTSRRWGVQRREWGENSRTKEWGIPPVSQYKIGAYVMILSNDTPAFTYVNGDCGYIRDFVGGVFYIELVRNGETVPVGLLVRGTEQVDRPEPWHGAHVPKSEDSGAWLAEPHYRGRVGRYVLGQVEYYPLRLAYASTVHKSQGLTLDRVQVDFRHWFFGREAMLYVALSRCRTLEGLRLVGQKDKFIKQCAADARVKEWL